MHHYFCINIPRESVSVVQKNEVTVSLSFGETAAVSLASPGSPRVSTFWWIRGLTRKSGWNHQAGKISIKRALSRFPACPYHSMHFLTYSTTCCCCCRCCCWNCSRKPTNPRPSLELDLKGLERKRRNRRNGNTTSHNRDYSSQCKMLQRRKRAVQRDMSVG